MIMVKVYDAKTQLSRLIKRVEEGEEVVITRHGRPVARLGSIREGGRPRQLGCLRGRIHLRKDFDAPLPEEVIKAFEGQS